MTSLAVVEALPGVGLAGDRYTEPKHRRSPDYEVTLIESENIEAFVTATGHALAPDMPRRNIVTAGGGRETLLGRPVFVWPAPLAGREGCAPRSLFPQP